MLFWKLLSCMHQYKKISCFFISKCETLMHLCNLWLCEPAPRTLHRIFQCIHSFWGMSCLYINPQIMNLRSMLHRCNRVTQFPNAIYPQVLFNQVVEQIVKIHFLLIPSLFDLNCWWNFLSFSWYNFNTIKFWNTESFEETKNFVQFLEIIRFYKFPFTF